MRKKSKQELSRLAGSGGSVLRIGISPCFAEKMPSRLRYGEFFRLHLASKQFRGPSCKRSQMDSTPHSRLLQIRPTLCGAQDLVVQLPRSVVPLESNGAGNAPSSASWCNQQLFRRATWGAPYGPWGYGAALDHGSNI
jgi:hypothetical protein